MKEIKYTILFFVFVRTFVIPFYIGSGTVINYGSGSNLLTRYDSGSTRQKVTVPTVPVKQHWVRLISAPAYLLPAWRGGGYGGTGQSQLFLTPLTRRVRYHSLLLVHKFTT
jgi:hypothetical protein